MKYWIITLCLLFVSTQSPAYAKFIEHEEYQPEQAGQLPEHTGYQPGQAGQQPEHAGDQPGIAAPSDVHSLSFLNQSLLLNFVHHLNVKESMSTQEALNQLHNNQLVDFANS